MMSELPGGIPPSNQNAGFNIPPPPAPEGNRLGAWGFAISLIAVLTCFLISPVAVLFSALGMRKEPKNLAIFGLIFGIVGTIMLPMVGIMVAIAVPSFLRAREISRRNACQENLAQIDSAVQQWALDTSQSADAVPTWDDLLGSDGYLTRIPTCPSEGTYILATVEEYPGCTKSTQQSFPHELSDEY